FPPDNIFVGLGETSLRLNPQPSGIVEQLVHTLIGNFSVEQLAHAWLRFCQDHLQLFWRILSSVFQHGLVQLRLKFQYRGLLGRESQIIEHIAPSYVSWPSTSARHALSHASCPPSSVP